MRAIVGDGGPPVANFAGGAAVARAARAELGAGRGRDAARERKNGECWEKRSCWGLKTGEACARGGHGTPPDRRRRHALATRRGMPDAVGRIRAQGGRRQRAGVGWAVASELGRGEGAGAVRSAGLASADGLEVRRWPVK